MKFVPIFSAIAFFSAIASGASTSTVPVTYDETYDKGSNSMNIVACSNGKNGLETTKGWKTISQVSGFPHIGGAAAVAGWNSDQCGTCWSLTYKPSKGSSKTIYVTAIDHAGSGFNIGLKAMNELTNNQAVQFGRVNVQAKQVAKSKCGS